MTQLQPSPTTVDLAMAGSWEASRGYANQMRSAADALLTNFTREQLDGANDFGDDLLMQHYAQDHLPYVVTRVQSSLPR